MWGLPEKKSKRTASDADLGDGQPDDDSRMNSYVFDAAEHSDGTPSTKKQRTNEVAQNDEVSDPLDFFGPSIFGSPSSVMDLSSSSPESGLNDPLNGIMTVEQFRDFDQLLVDFASDNDSTPTTSSTITAPEFPMGQQTVPVLNCQTPEIEEKPQQIVVRQPMSQQKQHPHQHQQNQQQQQFVPPTPQHNHSSRVYISNQQTINGDLNFMPTTNTLNIYNLPHVTAPSSSQTVHPSEIPRLQEQLALQMANMNKFQSEAEAHRTVMLLQNCIAQMNIQPSGHVEESNQDADEEDNGQ